MSDTATRLPLAEAEILASEIERLRGMIQYAIEGPDDDLPEALGGRAIRVCKKILSGALGDPDCE
jgi:hypothetical protein